MVQVSLMEALIASACAPGQSGIPNRLGFFARGSYIAAMLWRLRKSVPTGFIQPCLPSPADRPPRLGKLIVLLARPPLGIGALLHVQPGQPENDSQRRIAGPGLPMRSRHFHRR
jgi:hypothetical protein